MGVSASAVARVLGITTEFKDLREGAVLYLPQRIPVFAQGASDVTYPTEKFQITSAAQAGNRFGFGSPIHLVAMQLLPANGDGVGAIPVTVYPMEDDASGVAATGDITPTGTQTEQRTGRVKINNIKSEEFLLAKNDDVTAACAALGYAIDSVPEMPLKVTYTYDTLTSSADGSNGGDGTLDNLNTTGTPLPGDWTIEFTKAASDGGEFKLLDPRGTVIAEDLALSGGSGATSSFDKGGISFDITDGTSDFEVGDKFTITVPATDIQLTSKWKGESANDIYVEIDIDDGPSGITFSVTQPTGGAVNPDVDTELAKVGDVWETMGLNALNIDDTTTLDKFQTWGEGRWGTLTHKPIVIFSGNTDKTVADAIVESSARKDDRINAQLVEPDSHDLPFVVAARQLARIVKVANDNPPHDYGSQRVTGLTPGPDGSQWDYLKRDQAVKGGSSTIEVRDGVVHVSDVVTFYHPDGEPIPPYRHVVDIVKLQNIIFNIRLNFATQEWDGAPLVPDAQPVKNPSAKKPKMAKADANAILDSLGEEAIIANPAGAKKKTTASIVGPKRMDLTVTAPVSSNTNVKDATINFGFYFGSAA